MSASSVRIRPEPGVVGAPLQAVGALVTLSVLIVAVWLPTSALVGPVPSPHNAIPAGLSWLSGPGYEAAILTFRSAFAAFAIALGSGIAIGLATGARPYLHDAFHDLFVSGYAVPKLTLFPLFFAIFGLGEGLYLAMASTAAVFPVILNMDAAIRARPLIYDKVASAYGVSRWERLYKIRLPLVTVPLLTSVRLALSLSILLVILLEMIIHRGGVGSHVMTAYGRGDWDMMFGVITVLFSAIMVINLLVWATEELVKWRLGMEGNST